jgi:hypothetical protein
MNPRASSRLLSMENAMTSSRPITTLRGTKGACLLAAMILASFPPVCSAGIDDGLMAWWKLDGNAQDSGPNGNNGQIHGGVAPVADHSGRAGLALHFDGVDGYIGVPDSPSLHSENQRTVSMWLLPDPSNQFAVQLLMQGNHAQGPDGCERTRELMVSWYPGSHEVQTISAGDGACQRGLSAAVPADHKWHQMTTVIDRAVTHTMKIYIDGQLSNAVPDSYSSFNTSSEELRIAWDVELNGTRYRPYAGALDEIRLYDRALSAQEVRQLYESTMAISGVTHGYEHFGVWCRNKTTGQEVKAGPSHGAWDCEAAGLIVSPGDEVSVGISGTAF